MTPKLHPKLARDCHLLGGLEGCAVLLHRNAAVPWLILVPPGDATDLVELGPGDRDRLLDLGTRLGTHLRQRHHAERINIAAIGNVVPQLHLHIVGRRPDDPCWPRPVWGHLEVERRYSAGEVTSIARDLADSIGLVPTQAED